MDTSYHPAIGLSLWTVLENFVCPYIATLLLLKGRSHEIFVTSEYRLQSVSVKASYIHHCLFYVEQGSLSLSLRMYLTFTIWICCNDSPSLS